MIKPKYKTDTEPWFNQFLEVINRAAELLDDESFRKLENRILTEIRIQQAIRLPQELRSRPSRQA